MMLAELINEVLEKKDAIDINIKNYNAELEKLHEAIQNNIEQLVDAQLGGDSDLQKKLEEEIKSLRNKISDIDNLIDSYKKRLNNFKLPENDRKKIKECLAESSNQRSKLKETLNGKKEAAELKIKALEKELKEIEFQHDEMERQSHREEQQLVRLLELVDTKGKHIPSWEKGGYVRRMLEGEEAFFGREEAAKGIESAEMYSQQSKRNFKRKKQQQN